MYTLKNRNLLNFSDDMVVTYLQNLDEFIQDQLPTESDNAIVNKDDSETLPLISAVEAQRMI